MAKISAKSQSQVQVDDGYLLALAKQGSPDAYERLVRRYYSFVRLKASSYFLIGGDSDDLVQEGLVGLYKAIRDYRTDRESSFRNFAELCITRQIITAVKTATRNKHTPLNGYVSFSSTPAGATDNEPTLDEMLPGSTVHDPVNQVISSEELRSLVACLSTVLSELESHVLGALPRRALLHGHRRAARLRLQDGRQRAPARQAQGRARTCARATCCCNQPRMPTWLAIVLGVFVAARDRPRRRAARTPASASSRRTRGRFDDASRPGQPGPRGRARAATAAGRATGSRRRRAPRTPRERAGAEPGELTLVQIVDRPGTDEDKAVFRGDAGGRDERLTLGRQGGEWVFEQLSWRLTRR